jgi:long-chain acyl-CoA synthetase
MITIADYFEKNLCKNKFIYEIDTGKKSSFSEIYEMACRRVSGLALKPGSVVTVVLPNSVEYVECFIASMLGGWVFNPLPYFTQTQELEKILSYAEPNILITNREDIKSNFSDRYVIIDSADGVGDYQKFVKELISPEAPAALYYSSGTTGSPKGVLYSHKNMVSLVLSIIRGFGFSEKDRQLAFLPYGHTASINYNILPALMVGCDLYISQGFENIRGRFFKILSEYKITYTEIVPTVLLMLNKLSVNISNIDLSSISFIGCGSSNLPLKSQSEFMDKYGILVANLYGLSETGPSHIDDPRMPGWTPGSIGKPLDVNECRIAEDGEILLKGENIFAGYYKNKKLYNEVVKDGWFYTGDLGIEKDGKFYFIDRKKDLIILSGINIVPMEVEEVIYGHPDVLECAVVGINSKIHGEEIVVVIVTKNSDLDEKIISQEIKNICKQKLSSYKIPKKVYFWESIPKTHSKKIMRRKVREVINSVK